MRPSTVRGGRGVGRIIGQGVLWILVAVLALPVVVAVVTSLRPTSALYDLDPLAAAPTLEHYRTAVRALPLVRLLTTTAVMGVLVAAGQVALATAAAFGLVHFRSRTSPLILAGLLAATLVPQQALILPHYLMVARAGLLDTMAGLVLPQLASSTLAIYLLHQHIAAIPRELVDAAQVDGAAPRQILWRILIPLLRGPMAAVAIIAFIQSWNEYLWPLLATSDLDQATVQVGLSVFQTEQGSAWGPLLAAAVLVALPLLIAYVALQKQVSDAFLRAGLV